MTVSPAQRNATVGTSSAQALGANDARHGVIFINPSSSVTIYLAVGEVAAAVGAGIPIPPGDWVSLIGTSDGYVRFSNKFNAIADSGSSNNLTILELF